jgi:hypothetical protein
MPAGTLSGRCLLPGYLTYRDYNQGAAELYAYGTAIGP